MFLFFIFQHFKTPLLTKVHKCVHTSTSHLISCNVFGLLCNETICFVIEKVSYHNNYLTFKECASLLRDPCQIIMSFYFLHWAMIVNDLIYWACERTKILFSFERERKLSDVRWPAWLRHTCRLTRLLVTSCSMDHRTLFTKNWCHFTDLLFDKVCINFIFPGNLYQK